MPWVLAARTGGTCSDCTALENEVRSEAGGAV